MLARVLSGSKYGIQQARGRFGLGAKMALIWSKMTTAGELVAYTAKRGQDYITCVCANLLFLLPLLLFLLATN